MDDLIRVMQSKGRPELSLVDCGAAEGLQGRRATRQAFQMALDAVADPRAPRGRRTVVVDAGDFFLDRWVAIDQSVAGGVHVRGLGYDSCLQATSWGWSPILLGLPRAPMGVAHTPDHWFPLDGLLDASVKNRRGYRTGEGWLCGWACPLNQGPPGGWGTLDELLIEVAIDTGRTPLPGHQAIVGMSDGNQAKPWTFRLDGGLLRLGFWLAGKATTWWVGTPIRTTGKVMHLKGCLRLKAGGGWLAIDGQKATTIVGDFPPPGSRLGENDGEPFKVGGAGASGVAPTAWFQGGSTDLALCGLRVSSVDRYPASVFTAPHAGQYFAADAYTLGLLPFTDDPADVAPDRWVLGLSGIMYQGQGTGAFGLHAMHPNHGNDRTHSGPYTLADFRVEAGTWHGAALTTNAQMTTTLERLTLRGGVGIGSVNGLTNYTTKVRDCVIRGTEAGIYGYAGWFDVADCLFEQMGRRGSLWLVGCDATFGRSTVNGSYQFPARCHVRQRGGTFSARNLRLDNEDKGGRLEAAFDVSSFSADPSMMAPNTSLELCGSALPPGVPLVRLRTEPGGKPGNCRVALPRAAEGTVIVSNEGGWGLDSPLTPSPIPAPTPAPSPAPAPTGGTTP